MADRYLHWISTGPGRFLSRRLGLPRPETLLRFSERQPTLEGGPLPHLTAGRSACDGSALATALGGCGLPVRTESDPVETDARYAAVILDATGIRSVTELRQGMSPRRLPGSLTPPPAAPATRASAAAAGACRGPDR